MSMTLKSPALTSPTLNLAEHLLALSRRLHKLGQEAEASRLLQRLSRLRTLPADVAEETQQRLAEIRLGRRQYAKARRHLAAALAYQPAKPHYHYLMARATQEDDRCDPRRALAHYQQAAALDARQPLYWAELGLQALEVGDSELGVRSLRRAGELAPDNPDIIAKVVEGLCLDNRIDEAQVLLRAAQFRHRRDVRFQKLWKDFQFQVVRAAQQAELQPADDPPTILPFAPRVAGASPRRVGRKLVRRDTIHPTPPPHRPTCVPGRKHA